jgi:3-phosphoshikimate 1-carboxyvinyltransferase
VAAVTAPLRVGGRIRVPGDKSISHRALLFASLGVGPSRVRGILRSADVEATARVLRALGVDIPTLSPAFRIDGRGPRRLQSPSVALDCGNSGTTTRLVAGIVAGLDGRQARFEGDVSLSRRPMRRIAAPLRAMGARVDFLGAPGHEGLPMRVHGAVLSPIEWRSEHASAQVKGAILLAGLVGGVDVVVREPERSRDHTERMLAARGVRVEPLPDGVRLPAPQALDALDTDVPGDPSSATFFAALAALADAGAVHLDGVCLNRTRTGAFDVLRRMGASLEVEDERDAGGEVTGTVVVRPGALRGTTIRGAEIPRCIDELPMLACLAAHADGETVIADAAELRVKESDRIAAVVANLRAIGVEVEERPDGMTVRGRGRGLAGRITTHGDHRLAMAFGVLAALPGNAIDIDDRACVAVSYPEFWADLARAVRGEGAAQPAASPAARRAAGTGDRAPFVIAIDGPAASGKSSTAQWVAERLQVRHVDSGAFYRAATVLALESGILPEEWTEATVLAGVMRIARGFTDRSVVPLIDGVLDERRLREGDVTSHVSRVARMPAVRSWVNDQVRAVGAETDVVVDGRDIGTTVFPEAALKVFLIADPWERARRRLVQRLGRRPSDAEIAVETEALVERDARDATQSLPARDAITIDTTTLTQDEQVERIVALGRAARSRHG